MSRKFMHNFMEEDEDYMSSIEELSRRKPTTEVMSKAAEELSELGTKLLQLCNKPGKFPLEKILEEIPDVQSQLLTLQNKLFTESDLKRVYKQKKDKFYNSGTYAKYVNRRKNNL